MTADHDDALAQAERAEPSFAVEEAIGRKLVDSHEHGKGPIEHDVCYLQMINKFTDTGTDLSWHQGNGPVSLEIFRDRDLCTQCRTSVSIQ